MAKELEKAEGTFKPKSVWFRAWELMRESHFENN